MKKIIICLIFFVVCLSLSMAEMKKDSKTILQNIQRITFQDNTVQNTAASGTSNTELYADKVVSTSTMYSLGTFEAVGAAGFTRIFSTGTVSVTGRIEALGISGAISAAASSGFQLGTDSVIDASGVNMRVGRGYTNTEIHSTGFYTPWGGSRASISTWTASGLEVSGYGKFSGITHIAGTATFEDDIEMSGTNKRIDGNDSANIVNMNSISLKSAGQGNFYTRGGTADGLRDKGVGDFVFRNGNNNVMRFKHCVSSCVAIYLWDNDSATPSAPVIISSETPGRFFYCDPSYADWTMYISSLTGVETLTFSDGTRQTTAANNGYTININYKDWKGRPDSNASKRDLSKETTYRAWTSTSPIDTIEFPWTSGQNTMQTVTNLGDQLDTASAITFEANLFSTGTTDGTVWSHIFVSSTVKEGLMIGETYESSTTVTAGPYQEVPMTISIGASASSVIQAGVPFWVIWDMPYNRPNQQHIYAEKARFEATKQ